MKARAIKKDDVAKYTCRKCFHKWETTVGEAAEHPPTGCPSCGNLYMSWDNYKELTKPVKE